MKIKTLIEYLSEAAFDSHHYEGLSVKAQIKANDSRVQRVTRIEMHPGSNEGHFLTLEIWSDYANDIPAIVCFRSHISNACEIMTKLSTLIHSYPELFN